MTAVPAVDGERADKVVARAIGISRASARRLCEEGRVTVDGAPLEPDTRLDRGSVVRIEYVAEGPTLVPEEIPFQVRYLDDDLIVVDKPAGIVVHPGAGHRSGSLAAGLLLRWPELEGVGEQGRSGQVHRLDRDTSGLLLVARTQEAHRALQLALRARRVERRYLALAHRHMEAATGTIDAPLGRDPRRPTHMAVVSGGRSARTHYRRQASWDSPAVTLLEARLETGRTHQIRVHLASIGHPLVGDRTYGRPGPPGVDPGRVWLHAASLRLSHPRTGEPVEVSAPLPEDLTASLQALGPPPQGEETS